MERRLKPRLFELSSVNYLVRMEKQDLSFSEKSIIDSYGKKLMKREISEAFTCLGLISIVDAAIKYMG